MKERNLKKDEDRIGKYLDKYIKEFLFSEMSGSFIRESGMPDEMNGVPVPVDKKDVVDLAEGSGLSMVKLAENMACVIGCNPHFQYVDNYCDCIRDLYGDTFVKKIINDGKLSASEGKNEKACICFRAALCLDANDPDALFSYARICRQMYLESEEDAYVGTFKAESIEYFEYLTMAFPEFDMGHYFLGYAYLNMGLYKKAELAWKKFLEITQRDDEKNEIEDRMNQLASPVMIEDGCNDILAGRYEEGLEKLEPFRSSGYSDWWPLSYYLGIGYEMTGNMSEAVSCFKSVLKLNGSHTDSMRELYEIYSLTGDTENADKYLRKIELIENGQEW